VNIRNGKNDQKIHFYTTSILETCIFVYFLIRNGLNMINYHIKKSRFFKVFDTTFIDFDFSTGEDSLQELLLTIS